MKSIYLLFGDERFLIRQELGRILNGADPETLQSPSGRELAENVFTPSLFSPTRSFVVHDFDFREGDDNLADSLSNLPQGITLIFISPQNLDRRTKFFKTIEKKSEIIECRKVPEWEADKLIAFAAAQALSHGKKLSRESAERLIEYVGFDLGMIANEIEKLSVYASGNGEINKDDIEKMVPRTGFDAFTVTEALRKKDARKAYEALERSFIDREDPIELLGLISSQFRNLYKVKLLMKDRAADRYQIARQLKASPYYMGKIMASAGNFSEDELMRAIDALCGTDLRLKRGYDARVELPLLFLELLGEKK